MANLDRRCYTNFAELIYLISPGFLGFVVWFHCISRALFVIRLSFYIMLQVPLVHLIFFPSTSSSSFTIRSVLSHYRKIMFLNSKLHTDPHVNPKDYKI